METLKVLLTLAVCVALGCGEKVCKVGSEELAVPDEMDCSAFNERSGLAAVQPAHSRVGRSARSGFFWPGFPFPPGMRFPSTFPTDWQRWLRPRPPSRPRPRPPSNVEECPDEGIKFISHPDNCEKYILCMDGEEVTTLTCPDGLHFSRDLRSCTNPRQAGCQEFDFVCPDEDDPANIVFLPNKEDCTSYYLCWGGNQVPMNCAAGLHWSIDENMCMEPADAACAFTFSVNCPARGVHQLPNPDQCDSFFLCVNGNGVERSCPTGLHFSPHLSTCTAPETAGCDSWSCPRNSNEVSFIPNTDDCTRYYICLGGNQIERECAAGLHWSIARNMCMNPDDANCDFGPSVECPATGIHQLPHPDNCEDYFLCVNGNELERTCPNGLHFSPRLEMCASPESAGCDSWSCPTDSNEVSFIPDTEDCSRYYICLGGNQIERECGAGLHWSIARNMCMSPDDANCDFGSSFECPETGVHQLPNPDSCEDYYLCINGNEIERTCPGGMHFSPHLGTCAPPESAGCDSWSCPTDSNEISFIPNTEDCGSYYICLGGNQIERECSSGLHWSIANNMCMNPSDADCQFGTAFECPETGIHQLPNPDSCEDYYLCIHGTELERTCPNGMHFSPHLEVCTSPETAGCDGWKCPADSNEISFIPNAEDCGSYFICLRGNEVPMSCAPGLHWSITENSCMSPGDANCPFEEAFSCPETGIHQLPNPDSCEEFYLCVNGNEMSRSCPSGMHFSPHLNICTNPATAGCDGWECPEDSTDVTFIPNTEDCAAYFICFMGNKMPMTCNNRQHWSITENACMPASEAACPFVASPVITAETEAKAYEVEASEADCPATGITSVPNRGSCEDYFLCVNGMALPRECAPGLHFSRSLGTCVHPDVAECVLEGCPPGDLGFLPHEEDCNKYYLCFGGNKHPMRCPNDLHWSTETNSCMDPYDAECEEFDDVIECPATGIEQIPYPDDCERFILCINGNEIPLTCAPGLHFSPSTRMCMVPEEAECEDTKHVWKCPEEDTPGVIVFIPNAEDCSRYYLCWGGQQIPLACASGMHWSIEENRCMHPDEAECPFDDDESYIESCPEEGVIAIPNPESCESYILCVNGHEVPRDCPPGMEFSREIRHCVHPLVANCVLRSLTVAVSTTSNEDSCPKIANADEMLFMRNSKDCQSYYLCTRDESVRFSCAKGLAWSADKKKCMIESKAKCTAQ